MGGSLGRESQDVQRTFYLRPQTIGRVAADRLGAESIFWASNLGLTSQAITRRRSAARSTRVDHYSFQRSSNRVNQSPSSGAGPGDSAPAYSSSAGSRR